MADAPRSASVTSTVLRLMGLRSGLTLALRAFLVARDPDGGRSCVPAAPTPFAVGLRALTPRLAASPGWQSPISAAAAAAAECCGAGSTMELVSEAAGEDTAEGCCPCAAPPLVPAAALPAAGLGAETIQGSELKQ